MKTTSNEISDFIIAYFKKQSEFDGDGILNYWHPDGMMYLVGNNGEFRVVSIKEQTSHIKDVIKKSPNIKVEFIIDEVEHILIRDELIASVSIHYRMIFPDGYGDHRCFFNLVKIDSKWLIANTVDRGFQELQE